MKRALSLGLAAAGVLIGAGVQAQTAVAPAQAGPKVQTVSGVAAAKITTNRPYSGEAVTETTQVLTDGNRIVRTMRARVYRDGEGRTRRETFEPNADSTPEPLVISISDPVAKVSYALDPRRKVASKVGGNVVVPSVEPSAAAGGGGGYVRVLNPQPGAPPPPPPPPPPAGAVGMKSTAVDPNAKTESLGTQNIEGVMATGTRTTTTIPAGQIGNAQEIQVVSERWFSEDLQLLVLTKHNDPRSGESVYRLRNIVRAEPDPALFTVPADYRIEDRRIRKPE